MLGSTTATNIPIENVVRHYDVTGKDCSRYYVKNVDFYGVMFFISYKKRFDTSCNLFLSLFVLLVKSFSNYFKEHAYETISRNTD